MTFHLRQTIICKAILEFVGILSKKAIREESLSLLIKNLFPRLNDRAETA